MKKYYPAFIDIENQPCLVVGGGCVAEEKIEALLECKGKVSVISPELTNELSKKVENGDILWESRKYITGAVQGYRIVISATDSQKVNEQVYRDAEIRGIMVNVVDIPPLCRFIVPSIVRQRDLCIAISTGGKSPALAKKIRVELETKFGDEYADLVDLLGEYRPLMQRKYPDDINIRARLWTSLVDSDILDLIRAGHLDKARDRVESCILHLSD
tara:strand:- start:100624 stop:101268 length:645 start_codon:yes stop_codon:yes gene_type:complete